MYGTTQNETPARRLVMALAILATLTAAGQAAALERCKGKINGKDGAIEISASGVTGTLLWGNQAGQVFNAFLDAATCLTGGKAKKCELGAPGSAQRITPPDLCTVFLKDSSNATCSAYLRGCTPGVRGTGGGSFVRRSGDTMTGQLSVPSLRAGTPTIADCHEGGICTEGPVEIENDLRVFGVTFLGNNVLQSSGDGIVKAGLLVNCSNNSGQVSIIRQFNNVGTGSFSIDDGLLAGECTITSPFSLSDRYVVATGNQAFGAVAAGISGNEIGLHRWGMVTNVGPATGNDGHVFILIY